MKSLVCIVDPPDQFNTKQVILSEQGTQVDKARNFLETKVLDTYMIGLMMLSKPYAVHVLEGSGDLASYFHLACRVAVAHLDESDYFARETERS